MRKFISMTHYSLKLLFRDTSTLLLAFLMPIGFYILFSNMLKGMPSGGFSIQEALVPLYTIIVIGNAVIVVFGGFYAATRESGNLTKYKFLGINELLYSASLYSATLIFQLFVLLTFVIFAQFYAQVSFPFSEIAPIGAVLLIINIYQYSIAFFLNSMIRSSALYNSVGLTFYMFQMFLGGLTFPLEMFPAFLRRLVYIVNPIIYGRNALMDVWVHKTGLMATVPNLLILLAFSAGLLAVGAVLNKIRATGLTQPALHSSEAV